MQGLAAVIRDVNDDWFKNLQERCQKLGFGKSKIFTFPDKYSGFHYCLMSRPAVAVSSPLNTVFIRRPLHRCCHFILRQMLSKKVDYAHMVSKDMKQLDTTNDTEMNAEQCHVCSKQNSVSIFFRGNLN